MFQLIIRIASSEMKTAWLRRKGSVQAPPFLTPSLPPVQKILNFSDWSERIAEDKDEMILPGVRALRDIQRGGNTLRQMTIAE
jgi:hypothetical protein